ncbi:MAG: hypothetical protein HOP29_09950 [Phycisphaerales bacterium]|nr:hypothetical protein [Phycisphaerales bacterium]
MKQTLRRGRGAIAPTIISVLVFGLVAYGEEIDAELRVKVDAKLPEIRRWAGDPTIVKEVRSQNEAPSETARNLNQENCKSLSVLDPLVREFSKNEVGRFLKSVKGDDVAEAFVSAANGTKVGFLTKTTNWSHAGKPKHEVPMTGSVWYGSVEVDESTGLQQVQVSVPVLEDGKPIGSLVVGLDISRLNEQPAPKTKTPP